MDSCVHDYGTNFNDLKNGVVNKAQHVRAPDYISLDFSTSDLTPIPFLQIGLNVTYTRDGHIFVTVPEVGVGMPGSGGSARAGWIDPAGHEPSGAYVDNLISGLSVTGSAYWQVGGIPGVAGVGPSFGVQWGNPGQMGGQNFAGEAGIGVGSGRNAGVTGVTRSSCHFLKVHRGEI